MGDEISIRRAGRGDIPAIVQLVERASGGESQPDEAEIREWLFSRGVMIAYQADALVGLAGWQAENLLAVTSALYFLPGSAQASAGRGLLGAIEAEARTLMCEANVVVLPAKIPQAVRALLQDLGYEPEELGTLHRIWREVLGDFVGEAPDLMVKRLRDRMVMVPI